MRPDRSRKPTSTCRSSIFAPFSREYLDAYAGGIIIQPFLGSVTPNDLRILTVAGEFVYALSRSQVPMRAGEDPWLGSSEWASKLSPYEPSEQEIDIAKRASEASGAILNEMVLLEIDEGYLVMGNNPTPSSRENLVYFDRLCDALIRACT